MRIERLSDGVRFDTMSHIEVPERIPAPPISNDLSAFYWRFAMACFESGTIVSLPAREAITLPGVGGATLRVTQGIVWLTEENKKHDVVLRAGDNWLVESDGDTVVEAQNDVVFCVVGRKAESLQRPARDPSRRGILGAVAKFFMTPPRQLPYV